MQFLTHFFPLWVSSCLQQRLLDGRITTSAHGQSKEYSSTRHDLHIKFSLKNRGRCRLFLRYFLNMFTSCLCYSKVISLGGKVSLFSLRDSMFSMCMAMTRHNSRPWKDTHKHYDAYILRTPKSHRIFLFAVCYFPFSDTSVWVHTCSSCSWVMRWLSRSPIMMST